MKRKRGSMNRRDFLTYGGAGALGALAAGTPLSASAPPDGMTLVELDHIADIEEFRSLLILKDSSADQYLQISVSIYQAGMIRHSMMGEETRRPLTYEFFHQILDASDVKVRYAAVTRLRRMTYYADLVIEAAGEILKVEDCRPSDAIALAIQVGAPVYVAERVMNQEGRSKKEIEERLRRMEPLRMA